MLSLVDLSFEGLNAAFTIAALAALVDAYGRARSRIILAKATARGQGHDIDAAVISGPLSALVSRRTRRDRGGGRPW